MGLDSVELVMATEEHFGIEIPDQIAETVFTVGSLHEFVVLELQRLGRARDGEVVFAELLELICDQLGVTPERVVPEARFVQDLKID
jgi:acyl carrier protein